MWFDDPERLALLRCPATGAPLLRRGPFLAASGGGPCWEVRGQTPLLYREAEVQGTDRLMRAIYDAFPALHDPATLVLTPIMQGTSEAQVRQGYLPALELDGLRPREDGRPLRILEVGVGAGANLPLLAEALSPGLSVELWGVDLSWGMLRQCQRRLRGAGLPPTFLAMADAHALPFVDGAFDRVFHVGAMGSYRDPARALAEMARVAMPGTPVVVVDEQLDPQRSHGLYHRLWFRALTFYDDDPRCPVEALPSEAREVRVEQVSRFYYCLSFQMPVPTGGVVASQVVDL